MSEKPKITAQVVRPRKGEEHYSTWLDIDLDGDYVGTLVVRPDQNPEAVLELFNGQGQRRRMVEELLASCKKLLEAYIEERGERTEEHTEDFVKRAIAVIAKATEAPIESLLERYTVPEMEAKRKT